MCVSIALHKCSYKKKIKKKSDESLSQVSRTSLHCSVHILHSLCSFSHGLGLDIVRCGGLDHR